MWGIVLALLLVFSLPVAREHLPKVAHRVQQRVIVKHPRHPIFRQMLAGFASWYDCCNRTASGERLNVKAHTCAMLRWPIGTVVTIYDRVTHRRSWCRVNDHGPYVGGGRIIDLTPAVAKELGLTGVDSVVLYK